MSKKLQTICIAYILFGLLCLLYGGYRLRNLDPEISELTEYQREVQKYEEQQVRGIYANKNEITRCMTWALGNDWVSIKERDIPARWNERHGDLFELHIDDNLEEGNARIYEAWRKHKLK